MGVNDLNPSPHEARQASFERRELASFGPDDPYDFAVAPVDMRALANNLLRNALPPSPAKTAMIPGEKGKQ